MTRADSYTESLEMSCYVSTALGYLTNITKTSDILHPIIQLKKKKIHLIVHVLVERMHDNMCLHKYTYLVVALLLGERVG